MVTVKEWERLIIERYGPWKNRAVKADVFDFIGRKSGIYLEALFDLVRQTRPTAFGPPSLADLMKLNQEAIDRVELRLANRQRRQDLSRPQLPDPDDRILGREELSKEIAKLRAKIARGRAERNATKPDRPEVGPVTGFERIR